MNNPNIQTHLTGKQLLTTELPFPPTNKHITYRPAITFSFKKAICTRCGNDQPHKFGTFPCSRCQKQCTYCRSCIVMGRVSTCTPLASWAGPEPDWQIIANPLAWDGQLSPGQSIASHAVCDAVARQKDLLVWAVCGSGKTEVLFQGIATALLAKKRVCIATPRTDVVLELTPRLQAAFPSVPIASLYGGSEDRHRFAPLTIATTHQLLRFYKAFDVVILDEVDAFPYAVDKTLQFAVANARKSDSAMIYLTATPNTAWQRDCQRGKRNYVTIPARYHRHALPVPTFTWCGDWRKLLANGKLPSRVTSWITERLAAKKQALLFFPNIALMDEVLPILQKLDPAIVAVHSEDVDRKEKVAKMRNKEIPFLVTTTILERGVTFPDIDVAVLGAEDRIFTESALVQIAGRVGRSADYPDGDVTFFHHGKTSAMVRAKRQIESMNRAGKKRGLLDD